MCTLDISFIIRKKVRFTVIAFCGHSNYVETYEDERKIIEFIERAVGDSPCDFFLGEYGAFDEFCYKTAVKFKEMHQNVRLMFITPYVDEAYLRKHTVENQKQFDSIIYPEIEKAPLRYAISYRNRWIVKQADVIIAYVKNKFGGAYSMYKYAKQKNKVIYNIAE